MELRSLTSGSSYPSFVTQAYPAPLEGSCVPVFMFHSVSEASFAARMRFLSENGYTTLNADAMFAVLTGVVPPPPRAVALTFDDGELSWRNVALPILNRHGFTAIGFVSPGCLSETPSDFGNPTKGWLTWEDLSELQASGAFDIQSHTLHHERIFTGDRVMDYMRPGLFIDRLGMDRPRVEERGQRVRLSSWGAPLFAMASRMDDGLKFVDQEDTRAACVRHVATEGGAALFEQRDWRCRLDRVYRDALQRYGAGRWESREEQAAAMLLDLSESRRMLEERLQKKVLDIAYPWGIGGELATRLSREAGYRTNYRVLVEGIPCNRPGHNPFQIVRLKDDYLTRLPGKHRSSLLRIVWDKFVRRIKQSDIY